jgi:hypothetical protein
MVSGIERYAISIESHYGDLPLSAYPYQVVNQGLTRPAGDRPLESNGSAYRHGIEEINPRCGEHPCCTHGRPEAYDCTQVLGVAWVIKKDRRLISG